MTRIAAGRPGLHSSSPFPGVERGQEVSREMCHAPRTSLRLEGPWLVLHHAELYETLPEFEQVAPLGGPTIEQAVVTPEGLRIEHVRQWKSAEE